MVVSPNDDISGLAAVPNTMLVAAPNAVILVAFVLNKAIDDAVVVRDPPFTAKDAAVLKMPLNVPVEVDAKVGHNWNEMTVVERVGAMA